MYISKPLKELIIIVVFFVILGLTSLLFLLFNQKDTLVNYIPDNADVYLHTTIGQYKAIDQAKRELMENWLVDNFQLDLDKLHSFLSGKGSSELGIYISDNKVQALKKINHRIEAFNSIELKKMSDTTFINNKKKLNFSNFTLMVQNVPQNLAFLPQIERFMVITGDNLGKTIKLQMNNDKFVFGFNKISSKTLLLSENTRVYVKNASISDYLIKNLPFNINNAPYWLMKYLNGPITYWQDGETFEISVNKKDVDMVEVQSAVAQVWSRLYPREQEKKLPDGSIAINLVADPEKWTFEKEGEVYKLKEMVMEKVPSQTGLLPSQEQGDGGIIIQEAGDEIDVKMLAKDDNKAQDRSTSINVDCAIGQGNPFLYVDLTGQGLGYLTIQQKMNSTEICLH